MPVQSSSVNSHPIQAKVLIIRNGPPHQRAALAEVFGDDHAIVVIRRQRHPVFVVADQPLGFAAARRQLESSPGRFGVPGLPTTSAMRKRFAVCPDADEMLRSRDAEVADQRRRLRRAAGSSCAARFVGTFGRHGDIVWQFRTDPACELGQATIRPGDEALGLTSVLLHLGSRSIIAGVARIHDQAAGHVMVRYHRLLAAGADAAEAIAAATEHSADFPAPFVCFGSAWSRA